MSTLQSLNSAQTWFKRISTGKIQLKFPTLDRTSGRQQSGNSIVVTLHARETQQLTARAMSQPASARLEKALRDSHDTQLSFTGRFEASLAALQLSSDDSQDKESESQLLQVLRHFAAQFGTHEAMTSLLQELQFIATPQRLVQHNDIQTQKQHSKSQPTQLTPQSVQTLQQLLVVPTLIANRMHGQQMRRLHAAELQLLLQPEWIQHLLSSAHSLIESTQLNPSDSTSLSITVLSHLFGRIAMQGHAQLLMRSVLPRLLRNMPFTPAAAASKQSIFALYRMILLSHLTPITSLQSVLCALFDSSAHLVTQQQYRVQHCTPRDALQLSLQSTQMTTQSPIKALTASAITIASKQQVQQMLALLLRPFIISPTASSSSPQKQHQHTTTTAMQSPNQVLLHSLLTEKLLLTPMLHSVASLHLLIDTLASCSSSNSTSSTSAFLCFDTPLDQAMTRLASQWASDAMVNRSDAALQRYTHSALEYALQLRIDKEALINPPIAPPKPSAAAAAKPVKGSDSSKDDEDLSVPDDYTLTPGRLSSHPCLTCLMSGIEPRLSSVLPLLRHQASRAAALMSRLIDNSAPPLELEHSGAELDQDVTHIDEAFDEQRRAAMKQQRLASEQGRSRLIDGLPAYSITEPLAQQLTNAKVPLPRHLRDCLALLQKSTDADSLSAGLESCERLISRAPPVLADLAVPLAQQLLQVATTVFCTSQTLNTWRIDALTTLIVCICQQYSQSSASQSGIFVHNDARKELIDSLYSQLLGDTQSLSSKQDIICVLSRAALRLARPHEYKRNTTASSATTQQFNAQSSAKVEAIASDSDRLAVSQSALASSTDATAMTDVATLRDRTDPNDSMPSDASQQQSDLTLSDHLSIISQRVEQRTRRWGSTRRIGAKTPSHQASHRAAMTINAFALHALVFFVPLCDAMVSASESSSDAVMHSALLLGRCIDALGSYVLLAGPHSQHCVLMSKSLLRALAPLRAHTEAIVRQAVLMAHARCINTLPSWQLVAEFGEEVQQLLLWLIGVCRSDSDEQCRHIAQFAAQEIQQRLDAEMQYAQQLQHPHSVAQNFKVTPQERQQRVTLPSAKQLSIATPIKIISHHIIS